MSEDPYFGLPFLPLVHRLRIGFALHFLIVPSPPPLLSSSYADPMPTAEVSRSGVKDPPWATHHSSFSASQEGGSLRTLSRGTDVPFSGLPVGLSLPPFRIDYPEVRSAPFSSGPVHYSLNCRVLFSCRDRQYLGLTSDPMPTAKVSSLV